MLKIENNESDLGIMLTGKIVVNFLFSAWEHLDNSTICHSNFGIVSELQALVKDISCISPCRVDK